MQYGLCNLSIVALRNEPSDKSELTSQVLYGELFKVLEHRKKWSRIRLSYDSYEGWIDNKQFQFIEENDYKTYTAKKEQLCSDLVHFITDKEHKLQPIVMGSVLSAQSLLHHSFDGETLIGQKKKNQLIETAFLYLNTPYLWGGKTPFGIDCSGFTQMVYRLNGYKLLRDASQQATQGDALSFIEESSPGDLAFFDNNEGDIIHVGIIMENHYIIHAHGKVRIDRLDHSGIYNVNTKTHSHKLRVIKSIV
ncbi:C40 family peptidase [Flavobacteriaceae bacterium]|nr:C40 family peptidase [Flavobacteriaceae bacterium]MDB2631810.1 C40 family peptidase [Flavobacteriaceae bacterium]